MINRWGSHEEIANDRRHFFPAVMLLNTTRVGLNRRIVLCSLEALGDVEDRVGNPSRFDLKGLASKLIFRICLAKI